MRTKGTARRLDSAAPSGAASAPTFHELLCSHNQSGTDSGITYLYRLNNREEAAPAVIPVAAGTVARRYDGAAYLQVDWENLQQSVEAGSAAGSTSPARGLSNVYERLLERIERRTDSIVVRDLLLLISISRGGLTLDELVAISGCTTAQATELLSGLRNHLKIKEERVMLLNDYIARAVTGRYAGPNGEHVVEARERLAAFLETLAFSPRIAVELPWQLLELGALDRLEHHVTTQAVVSALCDAGRRGDLCIYWDALQERVDLEERYRTTLAGTEERSSEIMSLLSRYHSVTAPAGGNSDEIVMQSMAVHGGGNVFTERMVPT